MKLTVIGTGYVGLPTGVGFATLGYTVSCVDQNEKKIQMLKEGKSPLFEAGLEELLKRGMESGCLNFTTSMAEGVKGADVVIIAVGTPPHPKTKEADLTYLNAAIREVAQHLDRYAVVAIKSTVPVGTGDNAEKIIREVNPNLDVDVVSIPEFLREGYAVEEFFKPDRIIIGTDSERAREVLKELYKNFIDKTKMLFVKRRSSEVIKYASNAFLAMKIHYINEISDFCEKVNANVAEVAAGMGTDSRIGYKFLNPGPGYGGSCFPKDTMAMAHMGRINGVDLSLIENTIQKNAERKVQMANRILDAVKGLSKPKIGVLGLAFKGGTDDCRESPAMEIIDALLKHDVQICAYDPKAMENARAILGDKITYAQTAYDVAQDADVIAVLTEWEDFKNINFERVSQLVKSKKMMDCRNLINPELVKRHGFEYHGIGR